MIDGIRLSVDLEGIRTQAFCAIQVEHERVQESVKRALNEYVTEERVRNEMDRMVEETVRSILKTEIDGFFRYGKGRGFLKELCERRLQDLIGSEK